MENEKNVIFKVVYGEDMRRVSILKDQTLGQLHGHLATLFQANNLQLTWQGIKLLYSNIFLSFFLSFFLNFNFLLKLSFIL